MTEQNQWLRGNPTECQDTLTLAETWTRVLLKSYRDWIALTRVPWTLLSWITHFKTTQRDTVSHPLQTHKTASWSLSTSHSLTPFPQQGDIPCPHSLGLPSCAAIFHPTLIRPSGCCRLTGGYSHATWSRNAQQSPKGKIYSFQVLRASLKTRLDMVLL